MRRWQAKTRRSPACVTQSGRVRVSLESALRITNTFKNISVVRNFFGYFLCFKTKKVTKANPGMAQSKQMHSNKIEEWFDTYLIFLYATSHYGYLFVSRQRKWQTKSRNDPSQNRSTPNKIEEWFDTFAIFLSATSHYGCLSLFQGKESDKANPEWPLGKPGIPAPSTTKILVCYVRNYCPWQAGGYFLCFKTKKVTKQIPKTTLLNRVIPAF